jgi:ribose transport system substrate-binding protein
VIAIDATFGNPKLAVAPGIVTQVWQGRDIMAFLQVQALAKALPHAKVGLIGIGAPVPALKYLNQREAYYATKAGMTVLGTQDNPTDDVTGGEKAGNALIQRYPTMNAVIGYNDPSAIGAVTAARGAGRTLTVVGLNGTSDGIAGVRSGQLAATVQGQSPGLGIQAVTAAYDLITKQHLPLAKVIVLPPRIVTKANVDKIQNWTAQIAAIK